MWLIIIIAILVALAAGFYLFAPPEARHIEYGVVFSQEHARLLGLDWRETYLALLNDLKVNNIKIATQWDLLEPQKGNYNFDDLDWQLEQAKAHNANVMLVMGMKTPRWPECHIPTWAKDIGKDGQQSEVLSLLTTIVARYNDHPEIKIWQVENEPLFPFGDCPWTDKIFLAKEADLVRSLDGQKRPVLISDSGEGSWWFNAARIGDIAGTTLYRKVWFHQLKSYINYPLPPAFYWIKAKLVGLLFQKKVECVELQAEPWCGVQIYTCDPKEQEKTMTLTQFKANVAFAQKTGIDTFYLWGGEWWYWMKTKQNDPSIWEEARKLWR